MSYHIKVKLGSLENHLEIYKIKKERLKFYPDDSRSINSTSMTSCKIGSSIPRISLVKLMKAFY